MPKRLAERGVQKMQVPPLQPQRRKRRRNAEPVAARQARIAKAAPVPAPAVAPAPMPKRIPKTTRRWEGATMAFTAEDADALELIAASMRDAGRQRVGPQQAARYAFNLLREVLEA